MNLLWAIAFLIGSWCALEGGEPGLVWARFVAYVAQGVWGCAFVVLWMRSTAEETED